MDDDPITSCISEQAITAISKVLNNFKALVIKVIDNIMHVYCIKIFYKKLLYRKKSL